MQETELQIAIISLQIIQSAISYYDKVIEYGNLDADYAMFQKGFSLGLMNNTKGKIEVLTSLMSKYPFVICSQCNF